MTTTTMPTNPPARPSTPLPEHSYAETPQFPHPHARAEEPRTVRLGFGHPAVDDFLAALPPDPEMSALIQQRGEAQAELSRLRSLLDGAVKQKVAAGAAITGFDDAAHGNAHAAAVALIDGLPARIAEAEERRALASLACIRRLTLLGQAEIQRLYDEHAPFADKQSELLTKLQRHQNTPYGGTLKPEEEADLRADVAENEDRMRPMMTAYGDARQAVIIGRSMAEEMGIVSTDPWDWERSITEKILQPSTWADAAKKAGEKAQARAEYEGRGGDNARSGLLPRR